MWIGGVAFVTIIIFPLIQKMGDSFEQVMMFQRIEHRFARHARMYIAVSGITGGLMLYLRGTHALLFRMEGFGITVMVLAWAFYLLVLMFEKRIFKKLFGKPEALDMAKVLRGLGLFHWVVLGISLLAVFAGVWQGHGGGF
jgi:uncharacterized membrane protein